MFPIASITVGIGAVYVLKKSKQNYKNLVYLLFFTGIFVPVFLFFYREPASFSMFRFDNKYMYQDFMLEYAIHQMQEMDATTICINTSSYEIQNLEYLHNQEQFMFFLPDKKVLLNSYMLPNHDDLPYFIISEDKCLNQTVDLDEFIPTIYCDDKKWFQCPPANLNKPFKIMVKS